MKRQKRTSIEGHPEHSRSTRTSQLWCQKNYNHIFIKNLKKGVENMLTLRFWNWQQITCCLFHTISNLFRASFQWISRVKLESNAENNMTYTINNVKQRTGLSILECSIMSKNPKLYAGCQNSTITQTIITNRTND